VGKRGTEEKQALNLGRRDRKVGGSGEKGRGGIEINPHEK